MQGAFPPKLGVPQLMCGRIGNHTHIGRAEQYTYILTLPSNAKDSVSIYLDLSFSVSTEKGRNSRN